VETLPGAIDQRICQATSVAAARLSLLHCLAEESIDRAPVVTDLESAVSIGRTQGIDLVSAATAQALAVIVQPRSRVRSIDLESVVEIDLVLALTHRVRALIDRASEEATVQELEGVIDPVLAVIVPSHSQA
jgi:hypothetical protein